MIELMIAGVVTAATFWLLLLKIGLRKAHGYDVILDIIATAVMMLMFAGTYSGMLAAVFAGALFSVVLYIGKLLIGYERLETKKQEQFPYFDLNWVTHH